MLGATARVQLLNVCTNVTARDLVNNNINLELVSWKVSNSGGGSLKQ